tara:strand:+ start:2413 stop:2577 length:165 start_codon:yes stop_codon:yes gene_type:complete
MVLSSPCLIVNKYRLWLAKDWEAKATRRSSCERFLLLGKIIWRFDIALPNELKA